MSATLLTQRTRVLKTRAVARSTLPARARSVRARSQPEAPSPAQLEQEVSPRFRLIDVLLGNAASRIKRGTCTCIHCRGKGACSCPGCHGTGIIEPGQGTARMNMVRHAVAKLAGDQTKSSGQEWLQTNRCRRCHGVGELICANCKGSGLRFKSGPDDVCELPLPGK